MGGIPRQEKHTGKEDVSETDTLGSRKSEARGESGKGESGTGGKESGDKRLNDADSRSERFTCTITESNARCVRFDDSAALAQRSSFSPLRRKPIRALLASRRRVCAIAGRWVEFGC